MTAREAELLEGLKKARELLADAADCIIDASALLAESTGNADHAATTEQLRYNYQHHIVQIDAVIAGSGTGSDPVMAERERCAQIAEAIDSGRGNEKEIARAIRNPSKES